jgi:hypothetical protein
MTRVLISASPGLNRCSRLCSVEAKMLSCYGRVPNCGTDTDKSFLEYGKADRLYGKVGSNKVSSQQGIEGPFEAFGSVVVWLLEYPVFRASIRV